MSVSFTAGMGRLDWLPMVFPPARSVWIRKAVFKWMAWPNCLRVNLRSCCRFCGRDWRSHRVQAIWGWGGTFEGCVCVCKHLGTRWIPQFQQGVQAAHSVLHQRRHWMMLVISRLITVTYLPNSWWNNVAVGSPFSSFKAVASNFRPFSVACPTQFRCFSDSLWIRFRHMSDSISIRFRCMSVWFPITIHTTSTLTNYRLDYVGQC